MANIECGKERPEQRVSRTKFGQDKMWPEQGAAGIRVSRKREQGQRFARTSCGHNKD